MAKTSTRKTRIAKKIEEVTFYTSVGQMSGQLKEFSIVLVYEDERYQRITLSEDEAKRLMKHFSEHTRP